MEKIFVKRISSGVIYQVFEIDGSVIRVFNNTTGEQSTNRSSADLRFFKSILGKELHDQFVAEEGEVFTPEEIYNDNKVVIDQAVTDFILKERAILKQSLIINHNC